MSTSALNTISATKSVAARRSATDGLSAMLSMTILIGVLGIGWYYSRLGFITPDAGLGYALGIVGGSMMAIMLIYPVRKRVKALRGFGSVKLWFRAHMMLGVVGPTLVVLHTNFSLGSTNSSVALFCMVVVALSGLVGRYLYRQIHHGLYGQRASLRDLQQQSTAIRDNAAFSSLEFLDINTKLQQFEHALEQPSTTIFHSICRPFAVNVKSRWMKYSIMKNVRGTLKMRAQESKTIAQQRTRLMKTTRRYLSNRLAISRRIAMFRVYERFFSLWHVLHIPLFVILVISVFIHIYAVHAY